MRVRPVDRAQRRRQTAALRFRRSRRSLGIAIELIDNLVQALGWQACVLAPLIVLFGYVIFGMVGFGSTITNAPLLAQFLPLRFVVPLLLLLDLFASTALGTRTRGQSDWGELKRILPATVIGLIVGLVLLIKARERILLLVLGCFVLYAGISSIVRKTGAARLNRAWAFPTGLIGGVFSALYGTGGPIYTIYVSGRIADKSVFRATMARLIQIVGVMRLAMFTASGLITQDHLLLAALLLAPFAALGLVLGNRLHHLISARRLMLFVSLLIAVNGAALIVRAW